MERKPSDKQNYEKGLMITEKHYFFCCYSKKTLIPSKYIEQQIKMDNLPFSLYSLFYLFPEYFLSQIIIPDASQVFRLNCMDNLQIFS